MSTKLYALLLEDVQKDAELLQEILSGEGFKLEIDVVDKENDYVEKLKQHNYDIIFADFTLPRFNGQLALELAKKICPNVPFICISGTIGEDKAVELLKQGATDYVLKDRIERLPFATKRALDASAQLNKFRKTEIELQTNRNLLQTIINNALDLIYVKDIHGKYLLINEAATMAIGKSEAEIIGKDDTLFFSASEAQMTKDIDKNVIESGVSVTYEESFTLVDGNIHFFHVIKCPMFDDSGKPSGVFGIARDITERKRIEKALNERERQLTSIYDTVGDIIYQLAVEANNNYRFISVNQAFLNVTGLSENMVVGKLVSEVIPEPGLSMVLEKYKQSIETNSIVRWEETSDYPSGRLTGEVSIAPVFNDEGLCTHLVGSVHDITERKRAEKQLQDSHNMIIKLTDQVPGVVYQYRLFPDGRSSFPFSSYGMKNIYEVTPDEVREDATTVFGRLHPDDRDRIVDTILESARTQQLFHSEFRVVLPQQGVRWRLCDATPELMEDGSTLWYGIISDITGQKVAEETLRENNSRLELAMQSANMAWWEMDIASGNVIFEKRKAEMLGYPPDNFHHYKDFMALVHPDDYEIAMNAMRKHMSGKLDRYEVEYRIRTYSGEYKWFYDIGSIVKKDTGKKPLKVAGLVMDITGRKKTEMKLHESEEIFRNFMEYSPIYIFFKDENIRSLRLSKNYESMLGKPIEELLGKNMNDLFPSDLAKSMVADDMKILNEGTEIIVNEELNGRYYTTIKFPIEIEGKPRYLAGYTIDVTEKKLADDVLKETDRKLKEAQEMAHLGYWRWDIKTGAVEWSDEVYKIFKLDPNKFTPQINSIMALSPWPGDHERNEELIQRALKNHEVGVYEQRFLRPDNSIGYYHSSFQGIYDKKNDLVSIIGTVLDITERKNTEKLLIENEEKYRSLYENSSVAILLTSPDGNIYSANDYACKIFDMTNEEICKAGRKGLVDSNDPRLPILLEERGKTGNVKGELTFVRKDGTKFTGEISSTVFNDKDGNVRTSLVIRDLTEQKKAEAEVAMLVSNLHTLTISIKELSSARDMKTICNIVEKSARTFTKSDGITCALREGDLCYFADEDAKARLWKGEKFPINSCISGWAMLNKQPAIIEDIYNDQRISKDLYKDTFVKSLLVVPVNTREPIGAIGSYWENKHLASPMEIDLLQTLADSAAKAIENVNLYNELEQRVATRTKQLEDANKELESFSYSVSHDLRAPLRGIEGFTKILVDEYSQYLDEEGKKICSIITDNTRKMGQLINDLLSFSRVGRLELQLSLIDMETLVNSIFYEVSTPEMRERIDFVRENLGSDYGDPTLFRQVWVNLISNAIKFSAKKEKSRIKISCSKEDTRTVYCIEDNGAGFDMKYVSKIFNVFQRLHSDTEFEGTGVGLAIVQRIINRHGGVVWANGEINKGAKFYFTLPKRQ